MRITLFPPKDMFEIGARDNQEDCIFPATGQAKDSDRLFVLCDGMGGHEHGEKASAAICKGVSEYFQEHVKSEDVLEDEELKNALNHAYLELDKIDDGAFRKAGTTLTLLFFHKGGCTAAHIGDSRIYHVRPSKLDILYKSKDHSLVYELYQMGEISYEEMKTHRRKNQITRAMLPGEDNREVADMVHITNIRPGDYFFLCSDGVLENLDDPQIVEWMASDTDDDQKRQWLIDNTTNSKDNHSAFLIRIKDVEKEEGDESLPNDEQTVKFNAINLHPVLRKQPEPAVEDTPVPERQGSPESQKVGKTERKRKRPSLAAPLSLLACFILLGALGWWVFGKPKAVSRESNENQKSQKVETPAPKNISDDETIASESASPDMVNEDRSLEDRFHDRLEEEYHGKSKMSLVEEFEILERPVKDHLIEKNGWGEYRYKGPENENNQPDGKGMAMFKRGIYKGFFINGVMQGEAVFEFANGDVFIGEFKDNSFYRGILRKDHKYFEGSFRNGRPWRGTWYSIEDRDEIGKVVNGEEIGPNSQNRGPKYRVGPNGQNRGRNGFPDDGEQG